MKKVMPLVLTPLLMIVAFFSAFVAWWTTGSPEKTQSDMPSDHHSQEAASYVEKPILEMTQNLVTGAVGRPTSSRTS